MPVVIFFLLVGSVMGAVIWMSGIMVRTWCAVVLWMIFWFFCEFREMI